MINIILLMYEGKAIKDILILREIFRGVKHFPIHKCINI